MQKVKIKFKFTDLLLTRDTLCVSLVELNDQQRTEMSEVQVYRIFALEALIQRFSNRCRFLHPNTVSTLSFNLKEILVMKYCLMGKRTDPGVSRIFMQIDSHIHPLIQLEL